MNTQMTCPDCGVAIGHPHKNECDVEPCSVCGGQRCSCECIGHNPAKSIWTGVWPCKSNEQLSTGQIVTEGYVICGGVLQKERKAPPPKTEPAPPRKYPDHLLARNARMEWKTCFIEPVYIGGETSGDYRACRRCPDGAYEFAKFACQEAALTWAKKYERR